MKPKTPPRPLREQITAYLERTTEATAKQIAEKTTERDFQSRVLNELNRMRTDALVECEKRKGKGNEYYYWLVSHATTNAAQNGIQPQPAVGKTTGSDGSAALPCSAKAVAVHHPAPEPAASPSVAAPVAEDVKTDFARLTVRTKLLEGERDELVRQHDALRARNDQYDHAVAAIHQTCRDADIPAGLVHERVAQIAALKSAAESQCDAWRATAHRFDCETPAGLEEHVGELHRRLSEIEADSDDLGAAHDVLAAALPESDPRDPSDVSTEELARAVVSDLRNARALVDKLQHLLDSKKHECEALRIARAESDAAIDIKDAARGYLVRTAKSLPRITTKPASAVAHAKAAARSGKRAKVFALVPVGEAIPGAEWSDAA